MKHISNDIHVEFDVVNMTIVIEHDDMRYAIHSSMTIDALQRALIDDIVHNVDIVKL